MLKRGRKSAASLSVISTVTDYRPAAPEGLTKEQAEIWEIVVGRMPSGWFTKETHELLINYCRRVTTARLLSGVIDNFQRDWLYDDDGVKRLDKLTLLRDREVKAIVMLARSMRLSPSSRYRNDKAAAAIDRAPKDGRLPPWERAS
jgi:hypothetical protein